MTFDRRNLPDAVTFYESRGLVLTGRGKWRTTSCTFHGGSDSMRINLESGGFCCMACGAKGGDPVAYFMADTGQDFVEAAKALGCWTDDGRPATQHRPTALSPRQALQLLGEEAMLVAVCAGGLAHGVVLTDDDRRRLLQAAGRIDHVARAYA